MWASAIVEGQISADADAVLGYCFVGVEVDFLVFDRTPEPFDEDVVPPRTLAIHRDGNLSLLQHGGEVHQSRCPDFPSQLSPHKLQTNQQSNALIS